MSEQTTRKPLAVEDVTVLMALKAQVESHRAAINALEGTHNTIVENMRVRYNAPGDEGWQLTDYMAGFVLRPVQPEHDHNHH